MRLTVLCILLCIGLHGFSQTVVAYREAPLMGSGTYFLNGTAVLEEFNNGSIQFRLTSNYSTNSGPDVQIFLTNNTNFTSPVDLTGAFFVEDVGTEPGPNQPGINHFSGPYSKVLPALTSLTQYSHVVFVCFRFGRLYWGSGALGSVMTCSATTSSLTASACNAYTSPSGAVWTTSGTYTDTIPNAAGCDSVISIQLTVDSVNPGVTTSGNGLTLTSDDPNAAYQWVDCNNGFATIPGATNQSYTATGTGNYAVILSNGVCTDTSACYSTALTGIEAGDFGAQFQLFPNPSNGNAVLDLGGQVLEASRIIVTDILGEVVHMQDAGNATRIDLELDALESGIYFVAVRQRQAQKVLRFLRL